MKRTKTENKVGKANALDKKHVSGSVTGKSLQRIRGCEEDLRERQKKVEQANIELEERLAEIFFTHEFFKVLTSFITVSEVTGLIADGVGGILGVELVAVYLLNEKNQRFYIKAWHPEEKKFFSPQVDFGEGAIGRAASEGRFVSLIEPTGKVGKTKGFIKMGRGKSEAAVPLMIKGRLLGAIGIASTIPRSFSESEENRLITIGNVSSLALHNALLHEELERLSITDRLTELYNHGYFQKRLAEELDRAKRYDHVLSLIMLDIDHFKDFNDAFGHPKGNIVLRRLASILKGNIRNTDIAARYGGEEFVIILPETNGEEAKALAERVRRIIEKTSFKGNKEHPAVTKTVSLGIASYPKDAVTQEKLINKADQAMYQAKKEGRNRVRAA